MQDDHDLEHGPQEGEYHFSDEGAYETPAEETQVPEISEKSGPGAHFTSYRRFIILGGIFAGVLLVVYLLITPPSTPTPTQIVAATPAAAPAPLQSEATVASAVKPKAAATAVTQKMESIVNTNKTPVETVALAMPKPALPVQVAEQIPPQQMTVSTQLPPVPDKAIVDRLTALEEANSKMISQLNAEYASRLASFETQDKALQEEIRALTVKISGMEAQMNQLQQNLNKQPSPPSNDNVNHIQLNDNSGNTATLTVPSSEAVSVANKVTYAVQAIIPGRAWLRTENGETVTVAEGDLLKGLGRVTKIDPYDGTIQIDTGAKMILLSYGNGDYS